MAWSNSRVYIPDGTEVAAWDLDSTVRITMQRRWLLPEIHAGRKTWDDYSMACADDVPNPGAIALMHMLSAGSQYSNIAISGCSEAALDATAEWCVRHYVPLDDFLLRPPGDDTPNGEWKVAGIRRLQEAGLIVRVFLEDWGPAATYIAEHTGVPVLGINPFDPDTAMVTEEQLAKAVDTVMCTGPEDAAKLSAALFDVLPGKVSI